MSHSLIAELRSHEEKARLEHAHARSHRHGIEILEPDLGHHVLVGLQRDLEHVALLGLHEEEEHGLGLVGGRAHKDHAAFGVIEVVAPTRNRAPDVGLVAEVLVRDVVLRADEDARGPVGAARHGDEEVGVLLERLRVLAHHVVEAEVELVVSEQLMRLQGRLAWGGRRREMKTHRTVRIPPS